MTRVMVVLVLLFGAATALAAPSAEQRAQAKIHYEAGMRKFDVAKYDDAADEFQQAYEIIGDPVILYNIAQSFRLAQKYDKALLFYKNYLRRVAAAENRAEVERRIAEMTEVLEKQKHATEAPPTGTLKPNEPPMDNKPPEKPPEPVVEKPVEKRIEPPPSEAPPSGPPPATLKWTGVGLLAGGVALLAVGGAMSGLAASASSDVENAARTGGPFTPALHDTESNGKLYDTISIVGYAVGGAALVGGGVCLALGLLRKGPAKQARLLPVLSPGAAGLVLDGTF